METGEFRRKLPGEVSLLTYNILGGVGGETLFKELSSLTEKPDLVCFQEYPQDRKIIDHLRDALGDGYGYEESFTHFLKERTIGVSTYFNRQIFSLTEKREVSVPPSPLGNLERFILMTTVQTPQSWTRSALLTKFSVQGQALTLVNVHLAWEAFGRSKKDQAAAVLKEIENGEPALICGDFNINRGSARWGEFQKMFKEKQFEELSQTAIKTYNPFSKLAYPEDRIHSARRFMTAVILIGLVKRVKIDYVFGRKLMSTYSTTLPFHGSDHYPILTYIKL